MSVVVDTGTHEFSVNRDEIIRLAMSDCGALGVGEDIAPEDLSYCATKLNMLVKQWQGTADFAPGLKMWSRKRAELFLETSKSAYRLGPTGDHWVASGGWSSTTLTAAALAGASTIVVSSPLGIDGGDSIGVLLNSGAVHWTTVNGTPVTTTVTLSAALPSAAAIGRGVFFYTLQAARPLSILSAVLRDVNRQDVPLTQITLQEYEALPAKADSQTTGDPYQFYYESQLGDGLLYLDRYPADVTKYLHVVYLSPIADFNLSTDTPDYPQQWYRALAAQLALDIAPGFQLPTTQELMALRNDSVSIARNTDPDTTALFFQCYYDYPSSGREW